MASYKVFYEVEYEPNENALKILKNETCYFPKRFSTISAEIDGIFAYRVSRKTILEKAEKAENKVKRFMVGCIIHYNIFERLCGIRKHF